MERITDAVPFHGAGIAFLVARLAKVSVDEVLAGRFRARHVRALRAPEHVGRACKAWQLDALLASLLLATMLGLCEPSNDNHLMQFSTCSTSGRRSPARC